MKNWDLLARIKHGLGRKRDAALRLRVKFLLKLLRIDFQRQTELNYLGLDSSFSNILEYSVFSRETEVFFADPVNKNLLQHSFARRYLITLSGVTVNTEKSIIFDSNGLILSESSEWPSEQEIVFGKKPPSRPLHFVGRARLGLSNAGYYHWLTEDLPSFLSNDSKFPALEYSESNERNKDLYNLLGIPTRPVPEWVSVGHLDFTTRGKDLGYLHPEHLKILKRFAAETIGSSPKKLRNLYISRSKSRRSLPNEGELESFLEDQGYEIIYSEKHNFVDQIKLFSEAASIIAPHGAGLTNGIWSDEARILEIEPSDKINRCFEWQAKLCGQEYSRFRLLDEDLDPLYNFIRNWMH